MPISMSDVTVVDMVAPDTILAVLRREGSVEVRFHPERMEADLVRTYPDGTKWHGRIGATSARNALEEWLEG